MSEKEKFKAFLEEFGIKTADVLPEDVFIELDEEVPWKSALSVANLWFLFGKGDKYIGLLNDETMQFEARGS